eukprot:274382_1
MSNIAKLKRPYNPQIDFNWMFFVPSCSIDKLASKTQLDKWYQKHNIISDKRPDSMVISVVNAPNSSRIKNRQANRILKIYNIKDTDKKQMNKNIMKVWTEWIFIRRTKILQYCQIFYDKQEQHLIIEQETLIQSLSQRIHKKGPITSEKEVKSIMFDVLDKIWIMHTNKFVHCNIHPSNIMERYIPWTKEKHILNGWKVIGFNSMVKNNTKDIFHGTIGWTAPEIDYNSKTNVYTYTCDMFSFGLLILYSLFGKHPLQLPEEDRLKFKKDECKENEIDCKVLKHQINSNWYYGTVKHSENMMKNYLINLYYNDKISMSLFKLLHDGLLVYDPNKRMKCKQVYNSEWFQDFTSVID